MRKLLITSLALGALLAPVGAAEAASLSKAKVRAEAAEIGDEFVAHRKSTDVTGYFVAGCKRRSARRVICRLVLLNEGSWGQASCVLPVMGVLKRGRVKILLGSGDCL